MTRTFTGSPRLGGAAKALWRAQTPLPTITRPDPWNKGKAGPAKRREFEPDSCDRWISARRFEYKPLDDAAYTIRYRTLCFHYHPAVAAILAHDPIHGPGCAERRGKRTRREP